MRALWHGVLCKLEPSRIFREPRDASWQAFMTGDWQGALDLLEKDRDATRAEARKNAAQGLEIRRVRVAELPVGPYRQWEVHALKLLADGGFGLTVLTSDQVASLETRAQLPEVGGRRRSRPLRGPVRVRLDALRSAPDQRPERHRRGGLRDQGPLRTWRTFSGLLRTRGRPPAGPGGLSQRPGMPSPRPGRRGEDAQHHLRRAGGLGVIGASPWFLRAFDGPTTRWER